MRSAIVSTLLLGALAAVALGRPHRSPSGDTSEEAELASREATHTVPDDQLSANHRFVIAWKMLMRRNQ